MVIHTEQSFDYNPGMCLRNAVTSVLHSNGSALCENTASKALSDSAVYQILS
jgi:hypothetical protein